MHALTTIVALTLLAAPQAQDAPRNRFGTAAPPWDAAVWLRKPDALSEPQPSDFEGRIVVMHFFQSWCRACQEDGLPQLAKLANDLRGERAVALVAFQTVYESYDFNTPEDATKTFARHGLDQQDVHLAHDDGRDGDRPGSRLIRDYGALAAPWTVVIDQNGRIRYHSFVCEAEPIEALIRAMIAAPPSPVVGQRLAAFVPGFAPRDGTATLVRVALRDDNGDPTADPEWLEGKIAGLRLSQRTVGPTQLEARALRALREACSAPSDASVYLLVDRHGTVQWAGRRAWPERRSDDDAGAADREPDPSLILLERYGRELRRDQRKPR